MRQCHNSILHKNTHLWATAEEKNTNPTAIMLVQIKTKYMHHITPIVTLQTYIFAMSMSSLQTAHHWSLLQQCKNITDKSKNSIAKQFQMWAILLHTYQRTPRASIMHQISIQLFSLHKQQYTQIQWRCWAHLGPPQLKQVGHPIPKRGTNGINA